MRARLIGVATLAAACALAQPGPASAVACMQPGPGLVSVCRPVSNDPEVCVHGPEEICVNGHADLCVWDGSGRQVACAPIHWPPV